jgi:hypothetical protein
MADVFQANGGNRLKNNRGMCLCINSAVNLIQTESENPMKYSKLFCRYKNKAHAWHQIEQVVMCIGEDDHVWCT